MKKRVEIIDAAAKQGTGKTGSPYNYIEVTYKSEYQGKPEYKGYKALEFNTDGDMYETLSNAKKGDVFDVFMEKNNGGYWQWKEIHRQDEAPTEGESVAAETVTERQKAYAQQDERRQTLIVRQSVLDKAVTASVATGDMNPDDILALAETFEVWVNR